ncbi:MAG: VirB4 family type IV secretion system protein [Candidatus Dormibacteria bacterium]
MAGDLAQVLNAPSRRSTFRIIDVDHLEEGVAHLGDGSLRAALRIEPINLALQGDPERRSVWQRYRRLLAALAGPISLYSCSRPATEAPLPGAGAPGDPGLDRLWCQDAAFRTELIRGRRVQEQEHLLVVSGGGDAATLSRLRWTLARAGRGPSGALGPRGGTQVGLEQRCQALASELGHLGAQARRLTDGEWLRTLQLQGGGSSQALPASFPSWLAPREVEIRPREVRLDRCWSRSLFLATYPRRLDVGWLAPLLQGVGCELRIAQHVAPVPRGASLRGLRRKIRGFEASLVVDQLRGQRPDPGTESALGDALRLEEEVLVDRERLFRLETVLTMVATDLGELEDSWQEVLTTCAELGCSATPLTHRHLDGWRSTLPTGISALGWGREMTASGLATGFPFLRSNLPVPPGGGVLLGPSRISPELVLVDPFARDNPNFNLLVLGTSGAGKSYTSKLLAARLALAGCRLRCIDPIGEYRALVTLLGGGCHEIAPGRGSGLSPFGQPQAGESQEVRLARSLAVLEHLAAPRSQGAALEEGESQALEAALARLLAREDRPRLQQLVDLLEAGGRPQLALRIGRYAEGVMAGVFDGGPDDSDLGLASVFSLAGWEADRDHLLAPAMQMILNRLELEVSRDRAPRRLVLVDEAEVLLSRPGSARALESLSRRVRKWGVGLLVVSQVVEDFLGSSAGNVIVRNCHTKVLLRQEEVAMGAVRQAFGLSQVECELLREATPGSGIVIVGRERAAFQGAAPPAWHRTLCTDARENG